MMNRDARIFVAGHRGMVGSAVMRRLRADGCSHLIVRSSDELDLRDSRAVTEFFAKERPEYVFLCAARVGGILANDTKGADFIYDNLMIQTNVIHAAFLSGVAKLLFLGSSCIYPKFAAQPLREDDLLAGKLEPTNEPYAIAKIAGIKMCQAFSRQHQCNFISLMPTNLYGPNDNYDLQNAHVLPAMIRKFYEAKKFAQPAVTLWGTGKPRREFLHVDDLADACLYLMDHYNDPGIINVGTGTDLSIEELAVLIREIAAYSGEVIFDTAKPDGTPRKLLDVSRLHALGWRSRIGLIEGIRSVYDEYARMRENELKVAVA